ncbi:MAG: FAD-dependent oxidoreductase, partial [Steroidobacteraceae bacterium]
MDHCEVLIVGGGPAGSSCARELSRRGFEVTVMDRSCFPRDKVCAGWITPQLIDSLELDLDAYAHGRTLQPVSGFASGLMSGSPVTVRYPTPISYAIRRCEFDDYLLRRSGARLRLGSAIESLEQLANGWIVNGTLQCQLLIGAGGHFCPVARQLGAQVGRAERAIYAQELELKLSDSDLARCRVAEAVPELYFCDDLSGYGWCVRKGEYLNVGLGREQPNHLAA